MRIVLLGNTYSGKSSTGNTILGNKVFDSSKRTAECVKREGQTAGRHITVVEAPGWWRTYAVEETPECDRQQIVLSVSLCPPGPHALLLIIRVSESFTETLRRAVQEHLELLGKRVWSHTMVLFTVGNWLGDTTIEQHIESEGEALKWVVEKCGNRYHVIENEKSDGGQVTELLEKIEEMVTGNRGCVFEIHHTMDDPPQVREHIPNDNISESSEYGSTETGGVSGLNNALGQLNLTSSPKNLSTRTQDGEEKAPFVDASTITVNKSHCIGRGSYGAVYGGAYQRTPAAVKVIATADGSTMNNEFLIPLRLSHPNIVRMMAVSKTETQILIANEYIHGANLHQVIHTDAPVKLQHEDKLFVALDVAMALDYIHEKKIIHQDLKPANIMIAKENKKAYIMDWGMANYMQTMLITGGGYRRDQFGPKGGTEIYMAPECVLDSKDCSTMSDMWSFGITLLEMFTKSVAWSISTPGQLLGFLYKRDPPHALAKLQPPTDDIVKPLLEYQPESRMNAKDLVILLKSKVDLAQRYGLTW